MAERYDGVLVLDKPAGLTSRAAVDQVQRWFPAGTKIGHTGTLDPLACGVLVLCLGRATRLADFIQQQSKTYRSRFRLGAVSSTDDVDGRITPRQEVAIPSPAAVASALQAFVGTIWQRPPAFSALKVQGRRAYELARRGQEPVLTPRPVRIDAIRLLDYRWPFVDVEIDCGKGTYIRALARDVGERLGCGGYVETLQRLRIGPFTLAQALPLQDRQTPPPLLPPLSAVEHLPRLTLDAEAAQRFRHGQTLPWPAGTLAQTTELPWAVLDTAGRLLGLGRCADRRLQPSLVL